MLIYYMSRGGADVVTTTVPLTGPMIRQLLGSSSQGRGLTAGRAASVWGCPRDRPQPSAEDGSFLTTMGGLFTLSHTRAAVSGEYNPCSTATQSSLSSRGRLLPMLDPGVVTKRTLLFPRINRGTSAGGPVTVAREST
jgi:hypothetical protein